MEKNFPETIYRPLYRLGNIKIKIQNKLYKFVISGQYIIKAIDIRNFVGYLGAVHMSRASPANRADSILSRPMVA